MDCENIWVIQRSNGACLLLKPSQAIPVLCERGRQDFDCDFTAEAGVPRAVDFPHAASAKLGKNLIRPKLCAWSEGHELRDYSPRLYFQCFLKRPDPLHALSLSGFENRC